MPNEKKKFETLTEFLGWLSVHGAGGDYYRLAVKINQLATAGTLTEPEKKELAKLKKDLDNFLTPLLTAEKWDPLKKAIETNDTRPVEDEIFHHEAINKIRATFTGYANRWAYCR